MAAPLYRRVVQSPGDLKLEGPPILFSILAIAAMNPGPDSSTVQALVPVRTRIVASGMLRFVAHLIGLGLKLLSVACSTPPRSTRGATRASATHSPPDSA